MKIDLSGKTALVTGSTTGIGHAIARGLAAAGAEVTVNGRTQAKVDGAVAAIAKAVHGAKVKGVAGSVSTVEGCNTIVTDLPEVDILINNAGIFEPKDFFETPDEDWSRFFEVNVMSGVRLSRAYMQGMLKRNWGRIIFLLEREIGIVILDPPRRGADSGMLRELAARPVPLVLYLSCNPTTLARDLKILLPAYLVRELKIYDFFPHTPHIETLAVLANRKSGTQY